VLRLGLAFLLLPSPQPSPSGRGYHLELFCSPLTLWERSRVRAFVLRFRPLHKFSDGFKKPARAGDRAKKRTDDKISVEEKQGNPCPPSVRVRRILTASPHHVDVGVGGSSGLRGTSWRRGLPSASSGRFPKLRRAFPIRSASFVKSEGTNLRL
jgi:hypothetical protein